MLERSAVMHALLRRQHLGVFDYEPRHAYSRNKREFWGSFPHSSICLLYAAQFSSEENAC
jgi:hypothetical protein